MTRLYHTVDSHVQTKRKEFMAMHNLVKPIIICRKITAMMATKWMEQMKQLKDKIYIIGTTIQARFAYTIQLSCTLISYDCTQQ
jgi:high-affinity nickel permease